MTCSEARQWSAKSCSKFLHREQREGIVDDAVVRTQRVARNSSETKTVTRKAERRTGLARRAPVDQRVANQQRRRDRCRGNRSEVAGWAGVRLARQRTIAADPERRVEITVELKSRQNAARGGNRFVRQHGERRPLDESIERLADSGIGPRVIQEAAIVNREKPRERIRRLRDAAGREHAVDEHRGTVAHHSSDVFFGQRPRAGYAQQLVGRLREIAARVDEGSVEIEHVQRERQGAAATWLRTRRTTSASPTLSPARPGSPALSRIRR